MVNIDITSFVITVNYLLNIGTMNTNDTIQNNQYPTLKKISSHFCNTLNILLWCIFVLIIDLMLCLTDFHFNKFITEIGSIIFNLAIGYIVSYIFYYVVVLIKEKKIKK